MFKKGWTFIVDHNLWSKVLASLIAAGLIAVMAGLWSVIKNISFSNALSSFFYLNIPVWITLLLLIAAVYATVWVMKRRSISKLKPIEKPALTVANVSIINNEAPESTPSAIPLNLIFDSNRTYQNFYNGFGREEWDTQNHKLIGAKGEGTWSFTDKKITIARDNTAGRFIIEIKSFFYQSRSTNILQSNIYGRNPRHFKVTFKARAVSGRHKITIAFRDTKTKQWISEPSFDISNGEFKPQMSSVAIGADKQFVIEIHTWSYESGTTLQICDLLVEEVN
jgi:hypothetical protein